MPAHDTLTSLFSDIAYAIREKTGSSDPIIADDFPEEIANIPTGGGATEPYIEETYSDVDPEQLTSVVFHGAYTHIRPYMFYWQTFFGSISIPNTVVSIGDQAFNSNFLESLTLPSELNHIGTGAFKGSSLLTEITIPSKVTTVGNEAFSHCSRLETVTFKGTPLSRGGIGSDTFAECPNLTTINVPWAEGAVRNAPWGATNATINYNYTV